MSENAIAHSTFVLEREYAASPERVFAAWADPKLKARWFTGAKDADVPPMDLDFRVGGFERAGGGPEGGPLFAYEACFRDIVPNERIVLTNEMRADDERVAVGLVTMQFEAAGAGTRLTVTEQGVYLNTELDKPEWREGGTREQLENLAKIVDEEA